MKRTILVLALFFFACQPVKKQAAEPNANPSGIVFAHLNGQPITEEEVRQTVGAQLIRAEMELYDARKAGIDLVIEDRLLAAESSRAKMPAEELLKKNVFDKAKVTDPEIRKYYDENKARMQGKKFEEIQASIKEFLLRDKQQGLRDDYIAKLKKKADVEFLIAAPKLEVPEGDAPGIGPEKAPIRMVEFTDYQCPFCGRARPTINEVLAQYKGKVRYVLRDFPLSFHRDAFKAHEGAHCAGDQGKYWEMNKKLFENQKAIGLQDLQKYAGELKLKMDSFNQCLDSSKYAGRVQEGLKDGQSVGVSGTPAFFINGRMISGARPFESFKEIIDDELSSRN